MSGSDGIGGLVESLRDWADQLQRRHTVLGFPYAVIKKYGDDEGGRHAALLTYYGFLSMFPLMLLVTIVVSTVLQGNEQLRTDVIDAIVPEQLRATVENALVTLPTDGLPLVLAVGGLLFACVGIVFSAYQTLNHVATVPHRLRMEFVPRYLRIFAMLLLLLVGIVAIGAITVLVGALPDLAGANRLAAFAGTAVLVFLLLWAATGLLLPHRARISIVWPAALAGSLMIAGVLTFGAIVLPRLIARSGAVYGSFATIVALFSLIYIVNQVVVYAAEVAIVRRRRLWPRSLNMLDPTEADQRALTLLAREQERIIPERIETRFDAEPPA